MEDFDLKCLPTDFVGTSMPSKVISDFYERKEKAEKQHIKRMNARNKEICTIYENLIKEQSKKLKSDLNEVKRLIKEELHESKIQSNEDNAKFIGVQQFMQIYQRIQVYTQKQHNLVENFYANLVKTETDKAKEFTEVLKETYELIKRNSFKLPNKYDELIEFETEKINQTILCNNHNYVTLKTQLQAEIQNDTKQTIHELQIVKERWTKIIKNQTEAALEKLRNQTYSKVTAAFQELSTNLSFSDSTNNIQTSEEWLDNIRRTLALLDHRAQKAILTYKQTAVVIYKRNFEELKAIEESLADDINHDDISNAQAEMYTPSLEEVSEKYDVETGTVQKAWDDLVDRLKTTVNNAYQFLLCATTLWQKHFKRAATLQVLMTKDLQLTIQLNNKLVEPYEMKLNVLIDTLRQETTKEKLKKILDDIKKLLAVIEALYKSQHQSEVGVLKKYKNTQELRIEILLAEMNRFLKVYPPDMEKDPKIQRRRASQTGGIGVNSTDHLIPNQIIFCTYQIDAVANWQFGVWESIGNYSTLAKAEILVEIDKWMQKNSIYLEYRLEARYTIHAFRMDVIRAYIYEERLNELRLHQSRYDEHINAVDRQLTLIKNEYQVYQGRYEVIVEDYKNDIGRFEQLLLNLNDSYSAFSHKAILSAKLEKCIEKINALAGEYQEMYEKFVQRLKASNFIWVKSIKLFSEGGNYSIQEVKDLLKNMEKLDGIVDKTMKSIRHEVEIDKAKRIETIRHRTDEVSGLLKLIIAELRFKETMDDKMKSLKRNLVTVACEFQLKFKKISEETEKYKIETQTYCGSYNCFKDFLDGITNNVEKLQDIAAYLDEIEPVKLYSDKRSIDKTSHLHINVMTQQLFNFEMENDRDTFFMDFNKILEKSWTDIIPHAKTFYEAHRKCFVFGEEMNPHSLDKLMLNMYHQFCNIQTQCETRTMQDTKEYLHVAYDYLKFLQDYIMLYMENYLRICLNNFEVFFDTQIRQVLAKSREDFKNQYMELQNKLKSLSGHPKNRKLLENLQIEAEIINSDAKEAITDIKTPHFRNLNEEIEKITNDFYVTTNLMPELVKITQSLQLTVDNLTKKLKLKVKLIRNNTQVCKRLLKAGLHKSLLNLYDSKTFYELDSTMENWSTENSDWYKTPSTSLSQDQLITPPTAEFSDEWNVFPTELTEAYDRYYEELENVQFEDFIESLKKEWDYAVLRVLDLYTLKYNHQRG